MCVATRNVGWYIETNNTTENASQEQVLPSRRCTLLIHKTAAAAPADTRINFSRHFLVLARGTMVIEPVCTFLIHCQA